MLVPPSVDADVEDGVVTLCGTVHEEFEGAEAESTVRNLPGVRDVRNAVALEPAPAAPDVEDAIEAALVRAARSDAGAVAVEIEGGIVTLRGSVRSWSEHEVVVAAVRSVPRVRAVDDRLVVRVRAATAPAESERNSL